MSTLVVTWIASQVKSRYTFGQDNTSPDTWPLTKPARVHISWRTIRHPEDRKYAMLRTPKYSVYAYLSEADQDEIVLDENGVDTRKLLIGLDRDKAKQGARSIEES